VVIGAVFGDEIATVALMAGLAFIAAFVYFWILDRLDTSSIAWWMVAVIGVPLVFL
jgi:phosphatidylglycerophosphatase A